MAYQNKFDTTGRASQEGAKAEQVFKVIVDEFFDSDIEATSFSDQLKHIDFHCCLLYTSPSPRDGLLSRMPSSA